MDLSTLFTEPVDLLSDDEDATEEELREALKAAERTKEILLGQFHLARQHSAQNYYNGQTWMEKSTEHAKRIEQLEKMLESRTAERDTAYKELSDQQVNHVREEMAMQSMAETMATAFAMGVIAEAKA